MWLIVSIHIGVCRCVVGWCVCGCVCGCGHDHANIRIPYVCASLHITLHYPYSTVLPYKFHVSAVQVTHICMNGVWS